MLLILLGYHTHIEMSKGGVIIIPQEDGGGHVKEVSCVFNKYLKSLFNRGPTVCLSCTAT